MIKFTVALIAAVSAISAHASVNLVANGGFESSTYTVNHQFGAAFGGQGVTSWTGDGGTALQFYFFGGTQTTVSAINKFHDPKTYFYPSFSTLSPNGGNFVALDGDVNARGRITQTISGLTIGKEYAVSFDWAATQLANRKGATTEQILVGFGSQSAFTSVVPNPSMGFTGWFTEKFIFHATSTSQVLSFLSIGTPKGLPPIAALDGVSVTAVPEPAVWLFLVAGFGLVGVASRRRTVTVAA